MSHIVLTKPSRLLIESLRHYRANWWLYVRLVLLVQLGLILLGFVLVADPSFPAYSSLIAVLMNMAIIFTIWQTLDGNRRVRLKQSFYLGTARFVPFILAGFILAVALLPAFIGIALFSYLAVAQLGFAAPLLQQLLGVVLMILFSIPSLWLGTRWVFAPYAVMFDDLDPIAAIKYSRNLSKNNFWRVLLRIVALLVFIIVIGVVVAIPAIIVASATGAQTLVSGLYQIVLLAFILPFAQLYLLKLFRLLRAK